MEEASRCSSSTLLCSSALRTSTSFRLWCTGTCGVRDHNPDQNQELGSDPSTSCDVNNVNCKKSLSCITLSRGRGAAGYLGPHAGVPAGIVAAPQLQVPGGGQWVQHVVLVVHVEGVGEVLRLAGGVCVCICVVERGMGMWG